MLCLFSNAVSAINTQPVIKHKPPKGVTAPKTFICGFNAKTYNDPEKSIIPAKKKMPARRNFFDEKKAVKMAVINIAKQW